MRCTAAGFPNSAVDAFALTDGNTLSSIRIPSFFLSLNMLIFSSFEPKIIPNYS